MYSTATNQPLTVANTSTPNSTVTAHNNRLDSEFSSAICLCPSDRWCPLSDSCGCLRFWDFFDNGYVL